MADVKLSALTTVTSYTDDDLAVLVDDPGGTPVTRNITLENLLNRSWGQIVGTSGSQTVVSASTWTKVTQFTTNSGVARNATEDQANDRITIDNAGVYRAYCQVSWTNNTSVDTDFAIYWNGVITDIISPVTTGSAGSVQIEGIVDATTGSTDFELYTRVDTASTDVDVVRALLYVQCIGNT